MSESRGRASSAGDESIIPGGRSLEAFGRKITATAGHLMGDASATQHYQNAIGEIHRELRHSTVQRQIFNLAQASPRELVRSKISTSEIQHRALTYLPDEMLRNIPENRASFSLFQGFQASIPETDKNRRRRHGRHGSRSQKMIEGIDNDAAPPALKKLRNSKESLDHRLEMMDVRKNMCSTEIKEIDNKISNLNTMRKIVLERLADLEQEEADLENETLEVETQLEDLEEELEDEVALASLKPLPKKDDHPEAIEEQEASFMSESIYEKLPAPKAKRPKAGRRKTTHILHEHLSAGSKIREFPAHNDTISALDFDVPFGTMITAALDDTVRVWDLQTGHCMGLLEGHLASVRCLQVEDNLVATGSIDATIRLWDLSQADYAPPLPKSSKHAKRLSASSANSSSDDDVFEFADAEESPPTPAPSNMADCPLFTLSAHIAEITALHFHNSTLISGSADKTLRQWDLNTGRCVQTLDVLWAAAQATTASGATTNESSAAGFWKQPAGRTPDASADFVGALQCFDAALACGTADGLVRLWDLRSGQVHRSLVGHTGPVTCLQFDDTYLVTGSMDRSVRIWDLRTGSIFDAYAYDNPISSLMFDAKSIVAAANEPIVKVYDKTDGRHWDCGHGVGEEGKEQKNGGIVERVRLKDGYLVEGRKDGVVGVWSC